MKRSVKVFALAFIGLAAATSVAALLLVSQTLPSFDAVKRSYRVSDRAILDRNGLVIDEIRVDKQGRRLDWVALDQVSPIFIDVLLRAEDARFFVHPGVDPIALVNSAARSVTGHSLRGASTITMQLMAFIAPDKRRGFRRNWREKITQVFQALALEWRWSKREILEAYVNQVYFRGELQGLSAASHGLLDKAPFALTLPDSAVLASLIRAPNAQVEKIRQRACWLIQSVQGSDSCIDLDSSYWATLEQGYQIRSRLKLAPFVARMLVAQPLFAKSAKIKSTIDREIQYFANRTIQKHVLQLRSQNMNDGAIIVIENATGSVLAYVGNTGRFSSSAHVDAIKAPRQAGSTLKPFLFGKAIEQRILTAATILKDQPLGIAVSSGVYRPNNFDKGFRDLASVRSALGSSLNIPAVEALELLTVETFVDVLRDFGISDLNRPDFYGPSLALGSADVRLGELANSYRTLANGGMWSPIRFYDGQPGAKEHRALSEEASYVISDILSDRESRSSTFGMESVLSTSFWSAVKTGTSKDMRDNWCMGYSEKYTVGVWAGNFDGSPMWNVSGVQGAAPVWVEMMAYLHRNEGSHPPKMPEGVVRKMVKFPHSGQARHEVFVAGTEPLDDVIHVENEVQTRIVAPLDQTYIAIDPDIPQTRQMLYFQVDGPINGVQFFLNDRPIGKAEKFYAWSPKVGRHTLDLRSNDLVLDSVSFEVRGRKRKSVAH